MFSGHMGTKSVKRLGSPLFIELSKMSPFTGTTKRAPISTWCIKIFRMLESWNEDCGALNRGGGEVSPLGSGGRCPCSSGPGRGRGAPWWWQHLQLRSGSVINFTNSVGTYCVLHRMSLPLST